MLAGAGLGIYFISPNRFHLTHRSLLLYYI
jgi:hypothetical protein